MIIPIKDIKRVDVVQDEEYQNQVAELAKSIDELGLLHAVTVTKDEGAYKLTAGMKRLLAHVKLGREEIDCKVITMQDPVKLKLIVIEENLRRHNLAWYELVVLVKELHEIRQTIFGKAEKPNQKGWSLRDLSAELGRSLGSVAQDTKLADAILADPTLKKIKDKETALKIIRMNSKRQESEMSASRPLSFEPNQIFCGDSIDILPQFPAGCFDACITDPPWLHFHNEGSFEKDDITALVFKEVYRVLKYDSFLYMFVGADDFEFYKKDLLKWGFQVQGYPIIWHKTGIVSYGRRNWEHTRDLELILLAVKGNPCLVDSGNVTSVLKFAAIPSSNLLHPNQKPIKLMEYIINLCTYKDSLILDPFAGSGSTLLAAQNLQRRYIGIEREKKFVKIMEDYAKDIPAVNDASTI